VQDHARQISAGTSTMQKQLAPLMRYFEIPPVESSPALPGVSWREASVSCLDVARRVDRLLRSLLTASDSPLAPEEALPSLRQGLGDLQS
jgi:hypothetical protein